MKWLISIVLLSISIHTLNGLGQNYGRKPSTRLTFFDIELLRATAEGKSGNVLISPASVKSTLALILAGAGGETASEIERALRLSREEDVIMQLTWYLDALNANTASAVLQSANGVFVSKDLKLKPNYESLVRQRYHSEVVPVDFRDPVTAAVDINNWVKERTNGLIPSIVESIHVTPPNELILANALYFRSTWQHAFNPLETRSDCFFRTGECSMAAMMELDTELNYAHVEELGVHAVELPYEGRRYSMILLVPLYKDGLESLLRDLPYVGMSTILGLMRPTTVLLTMPKFTVSYNQNLVDALRKTHITTLFTNKSNLSNIFEDHPSYVNSFHHKVFMSVDESGTVAAASSIGSIVPLMFDGSVQVRADRPFLFFVRDNERDVMLFEGKIEEPTVFEEKPVNNGSIVPLMYDGSVQVRSDQPFLFFVRDNERDVVMFEGKIEEPSVFEQNGKTTIQSPIHYPTIERRDQMQPIPTSTTPQSKKSNSIVDRIKNFFG